MACAICVPRRSNFNSRPREGANYLGEARDIERTNFNSRPREGANKGSPLTSFYQRAFQFTPPRGGKPGFTDLFTTVEFISIHAPARGQTLKDDTAALYGKFQFTPPRGGKRAAGAAVQTCSYFNSRPREGANQGIRRVRDPYRQISIHAPARGQTSSPSHCPQNILFQFTPPRGGKRGIQKYKGMSQYLFQFTPPRGGKLHPDAQLQQTIDISIHAPARGQTGGEIFKRTVYFISIHAPARGQTQPLTACYRWNFYFNSRPREGANADSLPVKPRRSYFNSRPREGANGKTVLFVSLEMISIHAPARGQTEVPVDFTRQRFYFNSRPREGANRKTSQYLATIHSFNSNNSRKSAVKLHIMSHSRADNAV